MSKQTIAVVTTGGTISCRDTGGGAMPQLSGADLLRLVGAPADLSAVESTEWVEPLRAAVQRGIAVVLASRTGAGLIGDAYGYAGSAANLLGLGLIPAHELPGHKVRLQLMLALGNGLRGAALNAYFEKR
jgi:L-asparaginase/Glu-tRNA(Gln) amidotransferase subunit D